LPEDDVVLGKLSENAELEVIDFRSYVELFWHSYEQVRDEDKRKSIDNFIEQYHGDDHQAAVTHNKDAVLNAAAHAIDKKQNDDLRALLDNYNMIQLSDARGNNLLHFAAAKGNYQAAKILVMRGIKLNAANQKRETAIMIANRYNNKHIAFLLNKAHNTNKSHLK
jgi:uncharacterized protein